MNIDRVYYYRSAGVEMRGVVHQTRRFIVVADKGISGVKVLRSRLDKIWGKYFTTAQLAIEGFLAEAELMLADPANYQPYLPGLPSGIREARARLAVLPRDLSKQELRRLHYEARHSAGRPLNTPNGVL